jgi:hypothetical protein
LASLLDVVQVTDWKSIKMFRKFICRDKWQLYKLTFAELRYDQELQYEVWSLKFEVWSLKLSTYCSKLKQFSFICVSNNFTYVAFYFSIKIFAYHIENRKTRKYKEGIKFRRKTSMCNFDLFTLFRAKHKIQWRNDFFKEV